MNTFPSFGTYVSTVEASSLAASTVPRTVVIQNINTSIVEVTLDGASSPTVILPACTVIANGSSAPFVFYGIKSSISCSGGNCLISVFRP